MEFDPLQDIPWAKNPDYVAYVIIAAVSVLWLVVMRCIRSYEENQ